MVLGITKYEQIGLLYALILLYVISNFWNYNDPELLSTHNSMSSNESPIVGKFNASDLLFRRFNDALNSFESVLQEKKWTTIRAAKSEGITIERLDDDEQSWPPYIKTTAIINAPPDIVYEYFEWSSFDTTQKAIDPFYEGCELLLEATPNMKIIKKTTKRPFIYPKRQFNLGMITGEQRKTITILGPEQQGRLTIPRGTLQSTLLNVIPTADLNSKSNNDDSSSYVTAFQDFTAWFVPMRKASTIATPLPNPSSLSPSEDLTPTHTQLTIIMRVDLGRDIPHWVFLLVVGATGLRSMRSLSSLITKNFQKQSYNNYKH